jgi:hypothetical protein
MKEFGFVQRWVEEVGQRAVDALQNLEVLTPTLSPNALRPLRRLLTPDARLAVLPAMLEDRARPTDLEAASREAAHDMWLRWNWVSPHKYIHDDYSVFPPPHPRPLVPCPVWPWSACVALQGVWHAPAGSPAPPTLSLSPGTACGHSSRGGAGARVSRVGGVARPQERAAARSGDPPSSFPLSQSAARTPGPASRRRAR